MICNGSNYQSKVLQGKKDAMQDHNCMLKQCNTWINAEGQRKNRGKYLRIQLWDYRIFLKDKTSQRSNNIKET